jgi:hypothetical protein
MVGGLFVYVLLLCVGPFIGAAAASLFARERSIELRLGSRRVRLDLDKQLRPEQTDAFIHSALQSLKTGDEAGLRKVTAESHAASESIRRCIA